MIKVIKIRYGQSPAAVPKGACCWICNKVAKPWRKPTRYGFVEIEGSPHEDGIALVCQECFSSPDLAELLRPKIVPPDAKYVGVKTGQEIAEFSVALNEKSHATEH